MDNLAEKGAASKQEMAPALFSSTEEPDSKSYHRGRPLKAEDIPDFLRDRKTSKAPNLKNLIKYNSGTYLLDFLI